MPNPPTKDSIKQIAFLGLGTMGAPMAGHLSKYLAHYNSELPKLKVFNRTAGKTQAWLEKFSGTFATSAAEAAKNADLVISCVGNDQDVWEVLCESSNKNAAIQTAKPGCIFVDHTSISAHMTKKIASTLAKKDLKFMDAPISGGQSGAEQGCLTIMCGGEITLFNLTKHLLSAYAKKIELIGDVGSGQLCKMVNQICVAGVIQGLAEGMHFAKQSNLDIEKVFQVISEGAAGSWQMSNRYQSMHQQNYDFGFAVDWMRKDLKNCLQEATHIEANLPITAIIDQFYAKVQLLNGGRWDTSSLLELLEPPNRRNLNSTSTQKT